MDPITTLPQHALQYVFQALDPNTLLRCEQISKNWRSALTNPAVWKNIPLSKTTFKNIPKDLPVLVNILRHPKFSHISTLDINFFKHSKIFDIINTLVPPVDVMCYLNETMDDYENITNNNGAVSEKLEEKKRARRDVLTQLYIGKEKNTFLFHHLTSLSVSGCLELSSLHLGLICNSTPHYAHTLKKIDLSYCTQLVQLDAIQPLSSLTRLKHLDLGASNLTPAHLQPLSTLQQLEFLSFWNCKRKIEDLTELPTLWEPLKYYPKLTNFNTSGCVFAVDNLLSHIHCVTKLKNLNISSCEFTEEGIQHLTILQDLLYLNVWKCSGITDYSASYIRRLPNLTWLNVGGCKIQDDALDKYCSMSTLDCLIIGGAVVTGTSFVNISNLQNLHIANLAYCSAVVPKNLGYLASCSKLRSLNMRCASLTDESLFYLTNCVSIQVLLIGNNAAITDEGMKSVSKLTLLESLNMQNCPGVTDEGIGYLTSLSNLRLLYLGGCTSITDIGMHHLSHTMTFDQALQYLQSLNLGGCNKISDIGISYLKYHTHLQVLDLWGHSLLTNEGLACIGTHLPLLKSLLLTSCNNITDDGLQHLQNLTNLNKLDLNGCKKLTPPAIASIKNKIKNN